MEIQPGQDLLALFAPPPVPPTMRALALAEARRIGFLIRHPEERDEDTPSLADLEARLRRLRAIYGPEVIAVAENP